MNLDFSRIRVESALEDVLQGVTLRKDQLEYLDEGGQGKIYRAKIGGRYFIVKVFYENVTRDLWDRLNSIYKKLIQWRMRRHTRLPSSLAYRALPRASGETDQGHLVLIYNYLHDFETVKDLVGSDEFDRIRLAERIGWAFTIVKCLAILSEAGVIASDISSDNFALGRKDPRDKRGLFMIDLEGASPADMIDRYAPYFKQDNYFMRMQITVENFSLKLDPGDPKWRYYHDIWYGLQMVGLVIAGLSPLAWVSNLFYGNYSRILEGVRKGKYRVREGEWPPLDPRSAKDLASQNLVDLESYNYLREVFKPLNRWSLIMYVDLFESLVELKDRPLLGYEKMAVMLGIRYGGSTLCCMGSFTRG